MTRHHALFEPDGLRRGVSWSLLDFRANVYYPVRPFTDEGEPVRPARTFEHDPLLLIFSLVALSMDICRMDVCRGLSQRAPCGG